MITIGNNFYNHKSVNTSAIENNKNINNSNSAYSKKSAIDLNKNQNAIAFKGLFNSETMLNYWKARGYIPQVAKKVSSAPVLTPFEKEIAEIKSLVSRMSGEFIPDMQKALSSELEYNNDLVKAIEKQGGTIEDAIRFVARILEIQPGTKRIHTEKLQEQIEKQGLSALKQDIFIIKRCYCDDAYFGKLIRKDEKSFEYIDNAGNRIVDFFDGDYDKHTKKIETYNPDGLLLKKEESSKSYGRPEYTEVEEFEYDAQKKLIKKRMHNGDPVSSCRYKEYDEKGREIRSWSDFSPMRDEHRFITYDYRYTYDSDVKKQVTIVQESHGHGF